MLERYSELQYKPLTAIKEYQLDRLIKLVKHAESNTGYYKDLFQKWGIRSNNIVSLNEFSKIPFLTKNIVRNNFDHIVAQNIPPNRRIANATSGSTGTNFYFYTDSEGELHRAALQICIDEWLKLRLGFKKVGIWGSRFDNHKNNKNIFFVKSLLKRSRVLSGYNLTNKELFNHYNFINSFKPQLIYGYPSTLQFVAEYMMENKYFYTPNAIRSEGETMYSYQREIIQKAFGANVYNYYSSRDITGIAQECEIQSGLHILSGNVFLEIIDKNGNSIDEGEGEVVLTDLHNYVMPFIRYKIGDRAVITKRKCKCGLKLPLLERVEGRTFEIISFPNGNSVSGTFWTLLLKSKIGINNFLVHQKKDLTIIISMVVNDKYSKDYHNYIIETIKEYGGRDTKVVLKIIDNIPLTDAGKRRYIISDLYK